MKNNFKIPVIKPNLNNNDLSEVIKCFKTSWISSKSPWIDKFEETFAKKISKTKYSVAVNSGTSALFLALKALGIGPGDEVIVPDFTMIATINAVLWVGATPVLVDCASKTNWNIQASDIAVKITKKTKAIIPVHIYGFVSGMDEIVALAKKHKLFIIEDAAEAQGSIYKGKCAGSWGNVSCYSLYINKIMTTGNGGIVCTDDKKIYKLIKKIAFFDYNESIHFKHNLVGYNLVLSGLQAALGYSQTKRFDKLLAKRRLVYQWYIKSIKNKKISFLDPDKGNSPNYWFPAPIFSDRQTKIKAINILEKNKIESRDFFLPIHMQPVFKGKYRDEFPNARYFFDHGLLLPSYHDLSEREVKHICSLLNAI